MSVGVSCGLDLPGGWTVTDQSLGQLVRHYLWPKCHEMDIRSMLMILSSYLTFAVIFDWSNSDQWENHNWKRKSG